MRRRPSASWYRPTRSRPRVRWAPRRSDVGVGSDCIRHTAVLRRRAGLPRLGQATRWPSASRTRGTEVPVDIDALTYVEAVGSSGVGSGSARPHHDIPLMVDLYQAGLLMLDELVSLTRPWTASARSSMRCTPATSRTACCCSTRNAPWTNGARGRQAVEKGVILAGGTGSRALPIDPHHEQASATDL